MSCAECLNHVGHDPRCPAAPDEAPEYEDLDDDDKVAWLCEEQSAEEIAEMLVAAQNERDSLATKLRIAQKNADRWRHISRKGPIAMQIYDERLGVMTLDGWMADEAVDRAIKECKSCM